IMIPACLGFAGILINGWHSDSTAERRWHAAVPLLAAGTLYGCLILCRQDIPLAVGVLLLASGIFYCFFPPFLSLPTLILSETAAAACFGLIVSVSQFGGIIGPYIVGLLNDYTHSLVPSFGFIAVIYLAAGCLILLLQIEQPVCATAPRAPP